MQVRLEAIQFNHDPMSASADAYNIRKNEATPVALPEWQFGISKTPEDSPAAYSLSDTRDHVIAIKARFSISETAAQQLSIRAIAAGEPSSEESVLGEVAESRVDFANGTSDFTLFELKNPRIWSVGIGIGIHDIVWHWQFRVDASSPWTDFGDSSHRIYTTLNLPTAPWDQQPFDPSNTQLVWTDVLDYACVWAKGLADEDEAAASIVKEVFNLGPNFFQFDDKNHGHASYSDARFFDCTAFLLRLAGQESNGRFVNCTDCAAIVSTFANALGSSLFQARMAPPQGVIAFPLKPHLRIGLPNPITTSSFRYHEVAWKGPCGEADDVFDACLLVNGNNPRVFTVQPASNLPFGRVGQRQYRFSLVLEGKEAVCLPVSGSAIQRSLGAVPQGLHILVTENAVESISNLVRGFSFSGFESPDFTLQRYRDIGAESEIPVIQSFWRDENQDLSLIRIDAYECPSVRDARAGLSHLLDNFELPGMEQVEESDDRVLTFSNSEFSTVLFAAANIVFLLRNAESATSRLSGLVASLKEYVLSQATPNPLPSSNQPTSNTKENSIMSVFEGDWHSYIEKNDHSHQLESQDGFHLHVNSDGDLVASTHGNNSIQGSVNDALQSIVITENDPNAGCLKYEGSIVYQGLVGDAARFLACGRFILKLPNAEDQEQGTWVITKP